MKGRLKKVIAGILFAVMVVGSILPETAYAVEEGGAEIQEDDQILNAGEEGNSDSEETGQIQTDQEQIDGANNNRTDITGSNNQDGALTPEETDGSASTSENELESDLDKDSETGIDVADDASVDANSVTGDSGSATVGTVDFVYIESPYLETPDTQRIVFAFDTVSNDADSVTITVENEYGNQEEWKSVKQKEGLFLFEKKYDGEAYTGTYHVVSVNFYVQDQTDVLNLTDMNIEAKFGVNEEYDGYEELQPLTGETATQSEELGATVVTIDENGVAEAQDSIADALNVVSTETASVSSLSRSAVNSSSRSGNIVVALDPGHDSRSTGASGNGLREEVLTLKIANYCKEELEQYAGVEVYMTRTDADCPYDMDGAGCIAYRVRDAAAAGAQIYVSFHLNSSTSSSASGAEIIVQNNNWRPTVAAESQALAREILDELVALGLNEREIYWRNSESGSTYADGSSADYFSVQRNCKLYNIPGIIIEHAFLSNSSDANRFLKSETGLKSLGVADATGIAKYLGLSKEPYLTLDTYNYTGTVGTTYCLLAKTNNWDVVPTVEVVNEEIVKVERLDVEDSRGYLYNLTGLKEGSTQIIFTQGDKKETANVTYIDEGGFLLDTSSLTIDEGKVYQFLAKTVDKNGEVPKVQSKNPEIATVKLVNTTDNRGYLYQIDALQSGKTEIIVSNSVSEKSFPVTVNEGTLSLDTYNYQGEVGQVYGLLAICSNRMVEPTVEIDNEDIVSVEMLDANDSRGYLYQIKGLSAGSTTITFSQTGKEVKLNVTYITGDDFTLDTTSLTTKVGSIYQFLAKITDKTGGTPTAVSDDPKVASVKLVSATDSRGYLFQLDGISAGKTTIRVTYQGVEKSFPVTVTVDSDMKLDTYNYTGYVGQVYGLLVITSDRKNEPKVTVEDKSIVSVKLYDANDSRGYLYNLTGLEAGSTTITVEQNGKEEILKVTYRSGTDYELDTTSLTTKVGGIYQFLAKITDKTGGTPTVVSDDPKVASVKLVSATDSRGYLFQVDGISAGETTIRVIYRGVEKSFSVTVESDLSLDTYNYVGRAGQVYGLLVMTSDRKNEPTITVEDDQIVSVELVDKNDTRGYLYHLTGLKAGSTSVIVEQNNKQQILKVTYTEAVYDVDTKTVSIKQGGIYNFLVKGVSDVSLIKTESSDTTIARCSLYNANDSRGIMYQIAAFKDGSATITIDYCGTIKKINVTVIKSDLYEICGKSGVTVSDLVSLYKSSGKEYPAFYKNSDAPTLDEFCEIYYEESTAEGIKPEVAFCQAMLETAWLQYGGDVKIEQYNFAGLGATGNGVPGNSFPSVRIGVRAQIQHLKAYAVEGITESDLKYPCVDVRFQYVTKGCAPYVEWLGIQENPNGFGWASGKNYGYNIRNIINRIS